MASIASSSILVKSGLYFSMEEIRGGRSSSIIAGEAFATARPTRVAAGAKSIVGISTFQR